MPDTNALITQMMRSLNMAAAAVDCRSRQIVFENAKFFQWFPPTENPDAPLDARVTGLNLDAAIKRIENGRSYRVETEVKAGARTVAVSIEARPLSLDRGEGEEAEKPVPLMMLECHDISKQQESQYMLESYSKLAEKNARELQREKERVEKLLLNIMPRSVFAELSEYGTTTPKLFDDATVLMLDFVGFTDMAISRDPGALVAELNDIFSAFDRIVELFGCERIKTIGDAYMAVSGLPDVNAEHAVNIAKVALRMRRYIERRNESNPNRWLCRIGVATGPVIGSMVGIQKYVYDIFGPAVNLAARLEAICEPMQILINDAARRQMPDEFVVSDLDEAEIKGFGTQEVYSLDYERSMAARL
ncbi:MAG: adenylate/guanylate cyclase domain-containing protein [Pseudolabrys sp.]|jgi:adenylate cyclase